MTTSLDYIVRQINSAQRRHRFWVSSNYVWNRRHHGPWVTTWRASDSDTSYAEYKMQVPLYADNSAESPLNTALETVVRVLKNAGFKIAVTIISKKKEMTVVDSDGNRNRTNLASSQGTDLCISGSFNALKELDIGKLLMPDLAVSAEVLPLQCDFDTAVIDLESRETMQAVDSDIHSIQKTIHTSDKKIDRQLMSSRKFRHNLKEQSQAELGTAPVSVPPHMTQEQMSVLFEKIQILKTYGDDLIRQSVWTKGAKTVDLANAIKREIEQLHSTNDRATATRNIQQLIVNGHKTMGQDRRWSDIIAHICVALAAVSLSIVSVHLAGVVVVGMGAYKLYTGTFFVNTTQRQNKLRAVSDEALRQGLMVN